MKVHGKLLIFILAIGISKMNAQADTTDELSLLIKSSVELYNQHKNDTALVLSNKALQMAELKKDSSKIAACLNNISIIYNSNGDPAKSISYSEQALAILLMLKKDQQAAIARHNLGVAYKEQAIYEKAMSNLFAAATFFENSGDLKRLSSEYNTIGNIFRIQENKDKALYYLFKALKIRRENNLTEGVASSLNNIGTVYKMTRQYDSALYYLEASLKLKTEDSRPEKLANTLSQLGEVYSLNKNYDLALSYYLRSYDLRKKMNSKIGTARSLYELGLLYFESGAFSKSRAYLLKCERQAKQAGANDVLVKCYNLLKNIYTKENEYRKALNYAELYISLKDTILGEGKLKLLAQTEVKYETEKKLHEIRNLKLEQAKRKAEATANKLQLEAEIANNRNMVIGVIFLMLILFLMLVLFRNKMRFAAKLDTLMRELHHRVMNNFQVLLSLSSLQRKLINDDSARKIIISNSNRIIAMMLIHKELYQQKDITKVHMVKYMDDLINNLLIVYEVNHNVQVVYDVDPTIEMEVDKASILGLLINELATNAFKHAFGKDNLHPRLQIHLNKSDHYFKLQIRDNGPGMTVANNSSLGLKLAESQVKQLKGELKIVEDQGVSFEVTFK